MEDSRQRRGSNATERAGLSQPMLSYIINRILILVEISFVHYKSIACTNPAGMYAALFSEYRVTS